MPTFPPREDQPGSRRALLAGGLAAVALAAAILAGSRYLQNFDVALLGYALATIFLAFGVTYRTVVWMRSPSARRYLRRGWSALAMRPGTGATVSGVLRTFVSALLMQRFIAQRGTGRWLAHQGLFWGVLSATLITFPLTFGWIHFRAVEGTASAYWIYVMGLRTIRFDALGVFGWVAFHGLNLSALLIVAGGGWFLAKRFRERGDNLTQLGRDLLPLLALIAISVTGLLLTVSSALMAGYAYGPLAFVHMCTVVLTLVWVPFGKFFHTVQRPAMIGVQLAKEGGLVKHGAFECRSCGTPMEGAVFVGDLQQTMGELDLNYRGWIETCPACKRTIRGAEYRSRVKAGFS